MFFVLGGNGTHVRANAVTMWFISDLISYAFIALLINLELAITFVVTILNSKWRLIDIKGNVGLIFMKGDLKEVSEEVAKYKSLSRWVTRVIQGCTFSKAWNKSSPVNRAMTQADALYTMDDNPIPRSLTPTYINRAMTQADALYTMDVIVPGIYN
ncbi:hypothetical protein PTKIN_Ptkin03bG0108800 [Pterospermum kingtungense]